MTLSNFLLIGAMKRGTIARYFFLQQHPDVYLSPVKESNFLPSPATVLVYRSKASHLYLPVPPVAEEIHQHIPTAKLIAVLCNPVERAYSHHLFYARDEGEPAATFAQAIHDELAGKRDEWGFGHYVRRGFYFSQLQRYFDRFSSNQIKVYLFDDLKNDAATLTQRIHRFLDVDDAFTPDVSI